MYRGGVKPAPPPKVEDLFNALVQQMLDDQEPDGYQIIAVAAVHELRGLRDSLTKQTAAVLTLTKVLDQQVNDLIAALEELRLGPEEPESESEPQPGG